MTCLASRSFNVAIRTLILENTKLRYNVGSGLVLDSDPADEYAECLLKADVLRAPLPDLIETFLWEAGKGAPRLNAHQKRLESSAAAMEYPFNSEAFNAALQPLRDQIKDRRVKTTLNSAGEFIMVHEDYKPLERLSFALSKYPLSSQVQISAHKISNRQFYDNERNRIKALTSGGETVFLNENGELCEGSFTSLFIEKEGQLFTPHLSAGLLPGILRAQFIESGKAREATLTVKDLLSADKVYLGNSLRGLIPAKLISPIPC